MRALFLAVPLLLVSAVCYGQPAATGTSAPDTKTAVATPAPAPTPVVVPVVPGEPTTPEQAFELAKQAVEAGKAKNWFGLSAAAIFILMFLLKLTKLYDKVGKRWAYIILPALGVAAMLLTRFAGGLSWNAAWVVLTSAPAVGLLSDIVKRGIMGKEPTTPMKPV